MDALFVSADSHVLEPGDLWVKGLPQDCRARAPKVVTVDGKSSFVGEGMTDRPLSIAFAAGRRGDDMDYNNTVWENRPAAGSDLKARLEAQDLDGVAGEVLYPTLGLNMFSLADPKLKRECARAYNRWLGDLAKRSEGRLIAVGLLAVDDPSTIEDDIREAVNEGCRAIMPPVVGAIPFNREVYEPLWKTAEEMRLPVNFHIGAGGELMKARGPGAAMINYMGTLEGLQNLAHTLIWSGLFVNHPGIKVGFIEAGIGWIAPLLEKLDDLWGQHGSWARPKLDKAPSEFFKSNCYATFERDHIGLDQRSRVGVKNLMWATDYPHAESSWPNSRAVAAEHFSGIPEEERNLILSGNVLRLYNWDIAAARKSKPKSAA